MKLSEYAKKKGISYITAYRWFRAGQIDGYQAETGTIIVTEQDEAPKSSLKVAVYSRVSSSENKANLDSQADRLVAYCAAKGWQVSRVVKEIGSGVNDARPKFLELLADASITTIVVEHKDRASRFGVKYIETLLEAQGRKLEIVNLAQGAPENGRDDLMQDLVAVIYSFSARMYGQRRAKRKTEKIIKELKINPMQLVEQHVIDKNHPYFLEIDGAAFASKNLFNAVNYAIRQKFIFENIWLRYESTLAKQFKSHEAFKALPAKVAQQTMILLEKSWKSFFVAIKEWGEHPEKFLGRPALPKYKHKTDGRNILVYTAQAVSSKLLKIGLIKCSGLSFTIKTKVKQVDQVRIVPRKGFYVIEVVYSVEPKPAILDKSLVAGIDLGVKNFAVIASNKPGFTPLVVKGGPLKSLNQFYTKRKADLQKYLPGKRETSEQIIVLSNKRTRRVNHFMHTVSRRIVDKLVAEGIGVLVIGKNVEWKQEVNKGTRNNQNFVTIPHARFIEMLSYKCELVGIKVILQQESHTSKCSFLDNEPICHQERYAGKRVKRGLFRSASGKLINADLNGAYNIMRKAIPAAFSEGIEGVVVHPSPFGCK